MKGDWKKIIAFAAVAVIAFLLLYMLSIGPANAIIEGTGQGMEAGRIIYAPIIWLHDHTPLKTPIEKYVELWSWRR